MSQDKAKAPDWEHIELVDAMLELAAVRDAAAGRAVVDHQAAARAAELRAQWEPLAAMRDLNGEARGVAVLDTWLRTGAAPLQDIVPSDIERIAAEFRIGDRGRVDRAVFHRSGRLTLIEVKDGASPRELVAGIGQVLFYKAVMERTSSHAPIVPVLAVLSDPDIDVARACSLAGVEYLPLGNVAFTRWLSSVAQWMARGASA